MTDKRCKTCKWWHHSATYTDGIVESRMCLHPLMGRGKTKKDVIPSALMTSPIPESYEHGEVDENDGQFVITGESFGCIHHEEAEG